MEAATEAALASIMTVSEVAREAGVCEAMVKRWLAAGSLHGTKRGGTWLTTREAVARFLRLRNSC